MKHRLQKLLAQANFGSRRATEDFITAGRVKVNGEVAVLGTKADPDVDLVTLDDEKLDLKTPPVYIAYYKPVNVISSMERQFDDDRPTVREMIPVDGHLFSLGRLDVESEGLIILTNDGDLTNTLTHPRYEHTKTYQVTVYGAPDDRTLERWEQGVVLSEEDGSETQTAPCVVEILRRDGDTSLLKVVMTEGRNRQIRRVAAMLGHPVKSLLRTHIGRFGLGKLKRGEYADMTEQDLRQLTTPAADLETIQKIKAQTSHAERRAKLLSLSSATPEQIDEVRRNRLPSTPRPGKKYASRDPRENARSGDRRSRPSSGNDRRGPSDGRRPGGRPAFKSRLMLDETGRSTPGARDHGRSDTPEGFRSRLGETDRPERRGDNGDDRPRKVYGRSETPSNFRSRLGEADRPQRRDEGRGPRAEGGSRPPRRDGDSRPPRRDDQRSSGSSDRPYRPRPEGERSASGDRPRTFNRDGDSRPPRREGDSHPPRREGDSRPPRREGSSDRPYRPRPEGERSASGDRPRTFNRDGDSRPPRREGDSRPPRREGDSRPPRREGSSDRPYRPRPEGERSASGDRPRTFNRDGDSRPPRREGDSRPPRREGDSRPPRREGDDRPRTFTPRREGDSRPPRREGDSRPPRREGDSRPPRREGDSRPPRREGDDRPRTFTPRREGDSRPPRREGDSRPPRREGDSRPPRRDGDSRPPRREGDSRPPRREGDSRPPRREGDSRPPRREGDDRPRTFTPRRDGDSRPPRREGDSRPPRAEGERSSRPQGDSRPPRREGDSRPAGGSGTPPSNRPPARRGGAEQRSSRPPARRGGAPRPAARRTPSDRPARPPKKRDDEE